MEEKTIFAMFSISCVTVIQLVAWAWGHNGQVFALTSLIIGGVVGSILGFSMNKGK